MDEIKEDLFEYAFELLDSTISSVQSGDKDTTIIFSSLNIHKYFGKIEFGIEESFAKEAQLMIRDAIIHGEQPEYVITSYSIHYTKLYDRVGKLVNNSI